MNDMVLYGMIIAAVGLILFGLFLLLAGPAGGAREKIQARLKRFSDPGEIDSAGTVSAIEARRKAKRKKRSIVKTEAFSDIPVVDKSLRSVPWAQKFNAQLRQAKIPLNVSTFLVVCFVTGCIGGGMVFVLRGQFDPIFCSVAFALFAYVPILYVRVAIAQRVKKFTAQFPDALDLLSSSVRAGLAFTAAIQNVADEMPEPICDEFRALAEELSFNIPMPECLDHFRARINTVDVKFFCTAVMIQKEAGGNLAEILDGLQKTIRERFRIYGQIRTLTAQGRLSGWVLGILPIALGGIIYVLNPQYIGLLFKERLGHMLLLAAGLMQVVGFVLIRHIVNIKV